MLPIVGSSPRVRGTRASATKPTAPESVHPRVCGEHDAGLLQAFSCDGSSPRVRGTPSASPPRPCRAAVHPRVCGEHAAGLAWESARRGSSPRVRGTRQLEQMNRSTNRFIPACAGNTSAGRPSASRAARRFIPACAGNTAVAATDRAASNGSSPRVRGTRRRTPIRGVATTVHPRVCGEHHTGFAGWCLGAGSSPRVRGTRRMTPRHRRHNRFIPACAGNTAKDGCASTSSAVHPRVCGEHAVVSGQNGVAAGSSPRVRGTRQSNTERN